ncbi:hypothetical protein Tco_1500429, partial [Tanacetum coccineum]
DEKDERNRCKTYVLTEVNKAMTVNMVTQLCQTIVDLRFSPIVERVTQFEFVDVQLAMLGGVAKFHVVSPWVSQAALFEKLDRPLKAVYIRATTRDTSEAACDTEYDADTYKMLADADPHEHLFKVLNPATGDCLADEVFTACVIEHYREDQCDSSIAVVTTSEAVELVVAVYKGFRQGQERRRRSQVGNPGKQNKLDLLENCAAEIFHREIGMHKKVDALEQGLPNENVCGQQKHQGTTHALWKRTLIKVERLDILMVKVNGPPSLQSSFSICLRMMKAMPRKVCGAQKEENITTPKGIESKPDKDYNPNH